MSAPLRLRALGWLRRVTRLHPHLADLAAAAVIFAVTLEITMTGPAAASGRVALVAVAFAAVACGVLAARRSYPVLVLVISVAAAEAYLAQTSGRGATMLMLAPLIALYTVADISDRRRGRLVGGLAVLALIASHMLASPVSWLKSDNLALAALGGMALAAGAASRNRRGYLAEVEQRAQRAERTREQAERSRDQEARRRVTEERLRIAHDLHDSVGHHLALINVQTGVAGFLLDTDPDQARAALTHVTTATRSAMEEMHATIGLLREPGDTPAPVGPIIGLTGLGELIAAYRRSGLTVDHAVRGTVRRLPPAADLTAYRVIQESLTNVCKHAGRQIARIQLSYQSEVLSIVIDDDGLPYLGGTAAEPGAGPAGHGIVGMRERVAALGGEFHAGPRPAGGFRVSATLPLAAAPGTSGPA